MNKVVIIVVAIILIAGGGYLAVHKNKAASSTSSQTNSQGSNSGQNAVVAATITYDSSGFSPASVTVKSGDKVEIKNTSSNDVQVQSNPHPLHTDDPDLNVGVISAGQSTTFTVTKTGSFGYHNHLDPSQTGKITIQ